MGVELDRKRARDRSGRQVEERRHCCSRAKTWRGRKACRRWSSTGGQARPWTGQASPGGVVGILGPEAEKDGEEEVSHTKVLQANPTGCPL
ncbi:unnamed protein product [Pleuronectes platessa]|uniref:Uncharacterized protein n=1 Tax=Pleuronectes platessa TaxID=8262 RepID=A0A9N7VRZ1_PLEPL|nr:unnamed protein product [Pleuronectes platessa]